MVPRNSNQESADNVFVLGVDGWKERFDVKNTHSHVYLLLCQALHRHFSGVTPVLPPRCCYIYTPAKPVYQ